MGFVGTWVQVSQQHLDGILSHGEWTPQALEQALVERGASPQEAGELVHGYDDGPQWNSALARLALVKAFAVEKAFPGYRANLGLVAEVVPGAAPLLEWTMRKRPVVPLSAPWKATDVVGFDVVAKADDVRAVAKALAPYRDRAVCRELARAQAGWLPEALSPRRQALRLWVESENHWIAWLATLDALDAVAASSNDYLGFETA